MALIINGSLNIPDDSITNTKLENMAANTIKGRITASLGDPENLTNANIRTIINVADGAQVNQTLTSGDGMTNWTATNGDLTISLGLPSAVTGSSINISTGATHSHALTLPTITHEMTNFANQALNTTSSPSFSAGGGNPIITGTNSFQNTAGLAGVKGAGGSAVGEGYLGAFINSKRAGVIGIAGDNTYGDSLAGYFGGKVEITDTVSWSGGGSLNANTAYTHSQATHAPTNAQANQTLTSGNGMATWTATSGNLTISLGSPSDITMTSANTLSATSHTHNSTNGMVARGGPISGQFWEHFSGGLLIKNGAISLGSIAINSAWGNLFQSLTQTITFNTSIPFTANPSVHVEVTNASGNTMWAALETVTTTNFTFRVLRGTTLAASTLTARWTANGRG